MGADAHVVGVGSSREQLGAARAQLRSLDRRWSRFRTDSETSRLNAAAGRPVLVPEDTFELVARAVEAWQRTDGWFDPTILHAVAAAGYDRSFDALDRDAEVARRPADPAAGCGGIRLDEALGAVTLPRGVALDLGGIGKGHAADLVARALLDAGFEGACVNLGGDLATAGRGPAGGAWVVAVDDPSRPGEDLTTLALRRGAVATSSRLARSWRTDQGPAHHLLDPHTGRPSTSSIVSATVVAGSAADAEVLATAAVVAGVVPAADLVERHQAAAILVDDRGEVTTVGGLDDFAAAPLGAARAR